ncbi:hypothetical protein ACODT5_33125 [Streptomyces sp. 5.8]|uniref:hypothetical protein n=1 Tax=Streptomyces sp. 5.8 TaxID=3406571 RepID=UPI003BB68117
MARLNLAQLTVTAAQNIQTADAVRRDPAVVKAFKQFRGDSAQAVRSGAALASELGSSWLRHSPPTKRTETDD